MSWIVENGVKNEGAVEMIIKPNDDYCELHNLMKGQLIEVTSRDDGFYSLCPFVAGWGRTDDGRKVWVSMSDNLKNNDFEVVSWGD